MKVIFVTPTVNDATLHASQFRHFRCPGSCVHGGQGGRAQPGPCCCRVLAGGLVVGDGLLQLNEGCEPVLGTRLPRSSGLLSRPRLVQGSCLRVLVQVQVSRRSPMA